jgi:NADH dehydrogenase
MTTLVVGATGLLGSRVCKELAAQGKPVTAMVRGGDDPAKVDALRAAGVDTVEGDLKDAASLERACQGMDAVVSTASASISRQSGDDIETVDRDGQKRLIDAAKGAGVSRFVYISFSSNLTTEGQLTAIKREVERYIIDSGVGYTILRCAFLMEVMVHPIMGFDFANGKAVVYGTGETGLSLVSMDDVAKMVALCLDSAAAANAVIEFGGAEAITQHQIVAVFEEVAGRPFETQHVPEEAVVAQWQGTEDPLWRSLNALTVDYAHGDVIDMAATLQQFPLQLSTVRDYASKVLASPS